MKIDRISYKKIFPIGNYANETIGMEAQIDDGENVQEKLLVLKNLVEDFHEKNKLQLTDAETIKWDTNKEVESCFRPTATYIPSIDRKAIERLEILIDDAKTLDDLDKLRMDVQKYGKDREGLVELFNKRLSEISPSDTTTIN